MNHTEIKTAISKIALDIGFDVVAFTKAEISEFAKAGLQEYLALGHHGEMEWLKENAERRAAPKEIWQEAKSIIVLGHNYAPPYDPLKKLVRKDIGNISCYANGDDYHDVIKKKLKELAGIIATKFTCEVKVFVDTAPVMEKPLAQQAGIGWQGKHSCIVSRKFGSWLFLGEIFTNLELQPDKPETNHCGSCTKCLDICSTDAFIAPHKLDARKCITYLTIEHKTHIDKKFRKAIGNRIYGCDDCLAVCPWNSFAKQSREIAYHPREELIAPLLADLVTLDDTAFRAFFRKSPVKRIKRERFIRNVLIAIGNSEDKSLINKLMPLLADESDIVRASAIWALKELASEEEFYHLKTKYADNEHDEIVASEW